jgi:hypothetical protein
MAKADHEHWKQLEREARAQRVHVNETHCAVLYAGLLAACENILRATEAIADPEAKLAFIENLYTAIRRTVSVDETMEQLEFTVRELWEASRG